MGFDSLRTSNDLFVTGTIDLQRGSLVDSMPAPHEPDVSSRIDGMLLGLAIGEALGNISERARPAARLAHHGEARDYLPNPYADGRTVGQPSDDSQLVFWTREQLLADSELDHFDKLGARARLSPSS